MSVEWRVMSLEGQDQKRVKTDKLAVSAQAGEPAPFDELYDRVAPAVNAWAALRIPENLTSLISPEDLVQEVWFRAHQKIDDFDPNRSFRGWIFGFANHVLHEFLRQRASSASGHDSGGFDFAEVPDDATLVSVRAERNEGTTAFLMIFPEADEEERTLIALRGIEGLPFEEVARELAVSAAVVRKRWERLRKKLSDQEPPEGLLIG